MTRAVATKLSGILALAFCCVVHAELDDRLALIDDYVNAYVDMAAFDGVVLIAEGGNIVYRQNFGNADYSQSVPMSPETVFRIASLSKQVTQAAIGRLIDQGKLTTDQSLSEFLPDFPNAERISIRQLLDHTAGVAHTNRLGWMDMKSALTLDEIVEGLSGEELLFTPGENNQYSNGGYALLAKVIETVSEMTFGEFIASEFTHQGYPSIGHETANEVVAGMATRYAPGPVYGQRVNAETYITANRIGGGSLYATAADILRFFIASYGGEILSAATTGQMFPRPQDGDIQITGRSPGALAQIYLDLNDGLTVGTFSSNSAWPGSLNSDVVALYRGKTQRSPTSPSLTLPLAIQNAVPSPANSSPTASAGIGRSSRRAISLQSGRTSYTPLLLEQQMANFTHPSTTGCVVTVTMDWNSNVANEIRTQKFDSIFKGANKPPADISFRIRVPSDQAHRRINPD